MNNKTFIMLCSTIYLLFSALAYIHVAKENPHFDYDSHAYHEMASRFAQTNSFLDPVNPTHIPRYTFGYPFLLALFYKVFGKTISIIILFQILLALGCGLIIFSVAKKIWNNTVARIAFLLFTFNLGFIVFPQFLLIETVLVFLLLCFLERFITYLRQPSYKTLATSILFLSLSTLFKPMALYFIFFIIIGIIFFQKNPFKPIILTLLCFYIPIGTYVTINGLASGNYCLTRLHSVNIYYWFWPKVFATENNSDELEERAILEKKYSKEELPKAFINHALQKPFLFLTTGIKEVFKTFAGLFLTNLKVLLYDTIKGGDLSFFKIKAQSLLKQLHGYITAGTESTTVITIGYLELFYNLLVYIFSLLGFLFLLCKKEWKIAYTLGTSLFYFAMITCCDGCARFRMPFVSILLILAAFGIYSIIKKIKGEKCKAL